MSTETHVFFTGALPTKRTFQGALKELGFPFRLAPATGRLEGQDGYMPMRFRRDDTGVEFDVFDGRDAVDEFADLGIDPAFDRVANFRWSGDMVEAAAGQCGAAALAKLVGGVVFDEAEDRLLSVDEAAEVARRTIAAIPPPAPKKPRARQADIKRYLKPLLELRSDLHLAGRLLVIRPTRHLLRGAWFESSLDPLSFYLNWFVQPLGGGPWLRDRVGSLDVDHPQFLPLFHHCLRNVFERVARFATLDDYCSFRDRWQPDPSHDLAPVFMTEGLEAARRLLAEGFCYSEPEDKERFRALSEAGTEALLQHYREREAATVRALKIPECWEHAPFPIEVDAAERGARCGEPAFDTDPWPRFDPGWRVDMPSVPGDPLFAESVWNESGEYFLVGPISAEEARRRRAEFRSYALAKRNEDGALIVLRCLAHSHHWLADSPETVPARLRHSYSGLYLTIHHPGGLRMTCDFRQTWVDEGLTRLSDVDIEGPDGRDVWSAVLSGYWSELSIRDERSGTRRLSERTMDDEELAAVTLANPGFDAYEPMLDCVTAFLVRYGYGALE